MMKRRKYAVSFIILLTLLPGAAGCGRGKSMETVQLETGNLQTAVTETGTVVFGDSCTITPLSAGEVLTAAFEEGDAVTKGQVLFTVDAIDLTNSIEQAQENLKKANVLLGQAKQKEANLTVKTKSSGVVTAVYVQKGDYVTPGTKLAEIAASDILRASASFSVPKGTIKKGDSAVLTMQNDGTVACGTVETVTESGGTDGAANLVTAEITLKNPGTLKKDGMAVVSVSGFTSLSAVSLTGGAEQSVYCTQQGEIKTLSLKTGARVAAGAQAAILKNDEITNAVTNAQLSVNEIQTNIRQLKEKLADYTISAPISGIVIEKQMKEGDVARPGLPMVTIADNSAMYVDANIDEMFIYDVKEGQSVRLTALENDHMQYTGRVKRISDTGTEENGVTYYTVRIELDNFEQLISGMSMNVTILTGEKNTQYLPVRAVNGGRVKVKNGRKTVEKQVQTGIKNSKYIEILGGIDENETVLIERNGE